MIGAVNLRKVQEGYNKDISDIIASKEWICKIQDNDLKVIKIKEGKSEIYLPNYISRYSVTSEINSTSTFE